jgi:hypothetical protein
LTQTKRSAPARSGNVNGQVVKPYARIETISPERAEKLLAEANVRNRDIRDSRVVHLAEIIKRDEWTLSPDCIAFDLDGVLLNGQHRLSAAVVAEQSIEAVVLRNLPRKSQDIMDDTLRRGLGDALKLRGEVDVFRLAAGIGWYARIIYAEITGTPHYADNARRPSIPQLLAMYDENQGLREGLSVTAPAMRALKLRPGPCLAVWYRLQIIHREEADLFFDKLRSGADLSEGSPILALRRYSEEERNRGRGRVRNPDFRWVAVCFKAWNAWREGRSVKVLSYLYTPTTRETWPEPV